MDIQERIADLIETLNRTANTNLRLKTVMTTERQLAMRELEWAKQELKKIGEPAVLPLIAALDDPTKEAMHREAIHILGDSGDARAIEPIFKLLESSNEDSWPYVISALGSLKASQAIDKLCSILLNTDRQHTFNARFHTIDALRNIGDRRAVEPLIKVYAEAAAKDDIYDEDDWIELRREIVYALIALQDLRAYETFTKMLNDQSTVVRGWACYALGDIGDSQAFEPLVKMLDDPDKEVHLWAIYGLARLGDKRAVEPIQNLLNQSNLVIKLEAVKALGVLGDQNSLPQLNHLLSMLPKIDFSDSDFDEQRMKQEIEIAIELIEVKNGLKQGNVEAIEAKKKKEPFATGWWFA